MERPIVLNVGGFRYETFRSTLFKYPNTLLGAMFCQQNRVLLVSSNDIIQSHTMRDSGNNNENNSNDRVDQQEENNNNNNNTSTPNQNNNNNTSANKSGEKEEYFIGKVWLIFIYFILIRFWQFDSVSKFLDDYE